MRLIDANILKSMVTGYTKPHEFTDLIDKRPTVEAIPIEWVKKFRNQFETTDDYYNVIDYMLQLWEKENECNNKY